MLNKMIDPLSDEPQILDNQNNNLIMHNIKSKNSDLINNKQGIYPNIPRYPK